MNKDFENYNYVHSDITGKDYLPKNVVRILNLSQVARYLYWKVELLDIYPSIDYNTGKEILCFIFDRNSSKPAYDAWCKRQKELNEGENGNE